MPVRADEGELHGFEGTVREAFRRNLSPREREAVVIELGEPLDRGSRRHIPHEPRSSRRKEAHAAWNEQDQSLATSTLRSSATAEDGSAATDQGFKAQNISGKSLHWGEDGERSNSFGSHLASEPEFKNPMHLTPREQEKLMVVVAADLARRRQKRGLHLNYPEAIAIISYEIMEGARDGKSVAELMSYGATILKSSDVMEGVSEMIHEVQVEATFPDGVKLVTVHNPIR